MAAQTLVCPRCAGPELAAVERLTGTCRGRFLRDDDGTVQFDGNGYTEVDWDASTTDGVECVACGWRHRGDDWREQLTVGDDTDTRPGRACVSVRCAEDLVVATVHAGAAELAADDDDTQVFVVPAEELAELRDHDERAFARAAAALWDQAAAELPEGLRDHVQETLEALGLATVTCKFCRQPAPAATAHPHQRGWVGDGCCWDERLRASE